jgi:CDP-4-dehydro-6-deoxyglucose reductase, E3
MTETIKTITAPVRATEHTVHLHDAGKSFLVGPDETVLAASRRAGLALPYSCLSGRCGSCAARVLSGQWRYDNPPTALSTEERRDHALLCQAHPLSDLHLALKDLEAVAAQRVVQTSAHLVSKTMLAADVLRLMMAPAEQVPRLAGQYLEFVLPDGKRRPFSIANAPSTDGLLELHVRRVAGGGFTQQLFDMTDVGAEFVVDLPHGTFVPRAHSDRPLLLLAGGTGFAPIKALLEHFSEVAPLRAAHLYWGARVAADFYLPEQAELFQARMPNLRFTSVLSEQATFDSRYGNLHEIVLEDYMSLAEFDVYMSGPPAMISSARRAFLASALPEDRLYYDSFDFAPDVLAKIIHGRAKA